MAPTACTTHPSSARAGLKRAALGFDGAEEAMARLRESFCPEVLPLDQDVARRLREERAFESEQELVEAIAKDVKATRAASRPV